MGFVLDASVTMAWCFDDEAGEPTDAVLDRLRSEEALVPSLWRLEVANVLLGAERRGRITQAQAAHLVALLDRLPIRCAASEPDVGTVLDAGRRHGLSAYDAAYLLLAEREGLPLATLDAQLVDACRDAGVPTLPLG